MPTLRDTLLGLQEGEIAIGGKLFTFDPTKLEWVVDFRDPDGVEVAVFLHGIFLTVVHVPIDEEGDLND